MFCVVERVDVGVLDRDLRGDLGVHELARLHPAARDIAQLVDGHALQEKRLLVRVFGREALPDSEHLGIDVRVRHIHLPGVRLLGEQVVRDELVEDAAQDGVAFFRRHRTTCRAFRLLQGCVDFPLLNVFAVDCRDHGRQHGRHRFDGGLSRLAIGRRSGCTGRPGCTWRAWRDRRARESRRRRLWPRLRAGRLSRWRRGVRGLGGRARLLASGGTERDNKYWKYRTYRPQQSQERSRH